MSDKSKALAVANEGGATMTRASDWGPEHMRIVREGFAPGATQAEFEVMWAGAKARGLDPVKRQIFFVKRREKRNNEWVDKWESQVSIDGFRSIAETTGRYDGQDEPEFEYDGDGRLTVARVRVYRKGISRPFVGVARWNEYVQTTSGGDPTHMWKKMEHTMLAKCAEAQGLRRAFPEHLGGLYTADEMTQAESETPLVRPRPDVRPALPSSPSATAREMVDRIARAETADALLDIIANARQWPKVRGNAWLRMLALADSPARAEEVAILFEADELPPEIVTKLGEAVRQRVESFAEPTAA